MKFTATSLPGAFLIEMERLEDDRGFFARSWCSQEAEAHGLTPLFSQCNVSFNRSRGTLRGLHFQCPPHQEAKVVRCTRGALMDVVVDIRLDSPTYRKWEVFELTEDNRLMVYVPEGVAHGFQTLVDGTEVLYQMSTPYCAESARGLRWDDPTFSIMWPLPPILSPRDASLPFFRP